MPKTDCIGISSIIGNVSARWPGFCEDPLAQWARFRPR